MTSRIVPTDHRCGYCLVSLVRRPGETAFTFNRRRFCGNRCSNWWRSNGNVPNPDDSRLHRTPATFDGPIRFEGARVSRVDELPDQCTHCGGPWRSILGGMSCFLCGREVYIEEMLRVEVGRRGYGRATESDGHGVN